MNIGTYLYLIILFVVFTPGIIFSIPSASSSSSSSKWVRAFTHGFLFSVAWLFTHSTVKNIPIKEGLFVVNPNIITPYEEGKRAKLPPPEPKLYQKCFKEGGGICVGTLKTMGTNPINNFYCFGRTDGCNWGGNDCRTDADCYNTFNENSQQYKAGGCSGYKITDKPNPNDWGEWTCNMAKP